MRLLRAALSMAMVVTAASTFAPSVSAADNVGWGTVTSPEDGGWLGVTYAAGQFVAVGSKGTNRVMTSADGKTWTLRVAAEMNTWNAVTYGNGKFVAVAGDGTNRVMTSTDGVTWAAHPAASASRWQAVTYGNGLFVAVAQNGTYQIMTSPDGITWTGRSIPSFSQSMFWMSVAYGNGVFVTTATCFAGTGTQCVLTSPDGVTWTKRNASAEGSWTGVTFGNGQFVAVSNELPVKNLAMTSPDGITWTSRNLPAGENPYAVIYTGSKFVAAGGNGKRVMTSTDGITWAYPAESSNMQVGVGVFALAYGNNTYIGASGGQDMMASPVTFKLNTIGVIPRFYGPGPLKLISWAFRGAAGPLPAGTKVSVKVANASKKICKVDVFNHLVAVKSGICAFTLTVKPKTGQAMSVPLQVIADAKRK